MARDFKAILKAFRLRAGFGLREFAELIGDAPSNYVNIESGKRKPWKSLEKLRSVAEALALREGSQDWDAFFVTASDNCGLPPDVEHMLSRPMIPVLLRTVDELQLSEDELRELVADLRKTKGASNGHPR